MLDDTVAIGRIQILKEELNIDPQTEQGVQSIQALALLEIAEAMINIKQSADRIATAVALDSFQKEMSIQDTIALGKPLYLDQACPHTIKGETCPQSEVAPGYHKPIMCCDWGGDHRQSFEHALVSEPYYLTTKNLEQILAICKEHQIEVLITSRSTHNPGKCLHIVYHQPK